MKSSTKRLSAGWSFAAGTLFGALAVFVPLASLGIPGLKAEGSGQQRQRAMAPAGGARAPETHAPAKAHELDSVVRSTPTVQSGAVDQPRRVPGHSELDLQLD